MAVYRANEMSGRRPNTCHNTRNHFYYSTFVLVHTKNMFPKPLFRLLTQTQTDTLKTMPAVTTGTGKDND